MALLTYLGNLVSVIYCITDFTALFPELPSRYFSVEFCLTVSHCDRINVWATLNIYIQFYSFKAACFNSYFKRISPFPMKSKTEISVVRDTWQVLKLLHILVCRSLQRMRSRQGSGHAVLPAG